MGISSALNAGVLGLQANSSALSAISDNIANINTVGYKRNLTEFKDLVTANDGLKTAYTAGGVVAVTRQLVTQQGDFKTTTSGTDLALSGQGFFVVTPSATGVAASAPRSFTRAGSFLPDSAGFLRNSAGLYLQGWPADAYGVIASDPSDISKLQSVNINGLGGAAGASTSISVNANLDAGQTVSQAALAAAATPPGAGAYDPTSLTTSLANFNPSTGVGVKPDFTIPMAITDSLGGTHSIQVRLLKGAGANAWNYELVASPASQVTTSGALHDGQLGSGVLAFTSSGQLDPTATTGPLSGASPSLTIGASGTTPTGGAVSWAKSLGVAAQTVALNFATAPGGVTQFNQTSAVQSTTNNGVSVGNLSNVSVDKSGFVTATYDNGIVRKLAQVAVATFNNADGLRSLSGDAYQVTLDSGAYNLKQPGTGGAAQIEASQLESSTVDLSSEFTGLIIAQRSYAAASKIVTTSDQMLQELLQIKQ